MTDTTPEAHKADGPQGTLSGANLAASADSDAGPGGAARAQASQGSVTPSPNSAIEGRDPATYSDHPAQWKYPGEDGYDEAMAAQQADDAAEEAPGNSAEAPAAEPASGS